MQQLAAPAPSAAAPSCRPAVPIGSTQTLSRLALPLIIALHGCSAHCLRKGSGLRTSARHDSLTCTERSSDGAALASGLLGCLLDLRRTQQHGNVRGLPASPMRATRPNVGLVARLCVLSSARAAQPHPLPALATRPNPSLEPNCNSWPRQHGALRHCRAGQLFQSAQLKR